MCVLCNGGYDRNFLCRNDAFCGDPQYTIKTWSAWVQSALVNLVMTCVFSFCVFFNSHLIRLTIVQG